MKTLFLSIAILAITSQVSGQEEDITRLRDLSCVVHAAPSRGSGVIFTRKRGDDHIHFVWTAAHVIKTKQEIKEIVDPVTLTTKRVVEYPDVHIVQNIVEDGRVVGQIKLDAKIIRFSTNTPKSGGQDLALLQLYKKNLTKDSVKFHLDKTVPQPGAFIWHIGSPFNDEYINTTTKGNISNVGCVDEAGLGLYDQVSITAGPGASGGGIFTAKDQKCVGLLLLMNSRVTTIGFYRPVREMQRWAKKTDCLWAMDDSVPLPSDEDIQKNITDIGPELPASKEKEEKALPVVPPFPFPFPLPPMPSTSSYIGGRSLSKNWS